MLKHKIIYYSLKRWREQAKCLRLGELRFTQIFFSDKLCVFVFALSFIEALRCIAIKDVTATSINANTPTN